MAFAVLGHMEMVSFRADWVRRSVSKLCMGPYPSEVLGRLEYNKEVAFVVFINKCNTGN
jgi:hypothetical protein